MKQATLVLACVLAVGCQAKKPPTTTEMLLSPMTYTDGTCECVCCTCEEDKDDAVR